MYKLLAIITILISFYACSKDEIKLNKHDLKLSIEAGTSFTHNFEIGMGLSVTTTPQMAIWIEDTVGNYITTIFITRKIALQQWENNDGNTRREALPWWSYKSGFADALSRSLLADAAINNYTTPKQVIADAVTGATPTQSFEIKFSPASSLSAVNVLFEVNNSTDFNSYYSKNAIKGTPQYSGGEEGSGQPALVYSARINFLEEPTNITMQLVGHSSPDGIKKTVYTDVSKLTTALQIIKQINVEVK